jgi:cytochrome c
MSDLGFNKIAGAVLATGLAITGLHELSSIVYESEPVTKPGYDVPIVEDTGGAAAAPDVPPDWGTVLPTADVAAGQTVFAKCQSCHKPTDENGTGPGLNGILGRKPGSHPGFTYSGSMTDFGAKQPQWDYEHVYEFIKAPQKYISGTKMTFVGLKKPEDRINVIAYLHTLGSTLPIPAPNPAAAAAAAAPAPDAPAAGAKTAAPADGKLPAEPAKAGAAPAPQTPSEIPQTPGAAGHK